jgi:hypothetical protein
MPFAEKEWEFEMVYRSNANGARNCNDGEGTDKQIIMWNGSRMDGDGKLQSGWRADGCLKEWRRLLLADGETRKCRQGASGQNNDETTILLTRKMSSIVLINLYCSKVVEMVLLLKAFAFENCRQRIKSTHQWTILTQGPIKNVEPLAGRNSMQGSMRESKLNRRKDELYVLATVKLYRQS